MMESILLNYLSIHQVQLTLVPDAPVMMSSPPLHVPQVFTKSRCFHSQVFIYMFNLNIKKLNENAINSTTREILYLHLAEVEKFLSQ